MDLAPVSGVSLPFCCHAVLVGSEEEMEQKWLKWKDWPQLPLCKKSAHTHTHTHTHRLWDPAYFCCFQRVEATLPQLLGPSFRAVSAVLMGWCVCVFRRSGFGPGMFVFVFHNMHWANFSLPFARENNVSTQRAHSFSSFLNPSALPLCLQLPLVSCSSVRRPVSAGWFWESRVLTSSCPSMSWGTSELSATTRWTGWSTGWMDDRIYAGPETMEPW